MKYRNQDEGGDLFAFIEYLKKAKARQRSNGLAGLWRSSIGRAFEAISRIYWAT